MLNQHTSLQQMRNTRNSYSMSVND